MLEEKKNIDELFHDILIDHGEDMPDYVWNNIERDLKGDKKRRSLIVWFSAAASVAILLSFAAGYMLSSNQHSDNAIVAETTISNDLNNADIESNNFVADNIIADDDKESYNVNSVEKTSEVPRQNDNSISIEKNSTYVADNITVNNNQPKSDNQNSFVTSISDAKIDNTVSTNLSLTESLDNEVDIAENSEVENIPLNNSDTEDNLIVEDKNKGQFNSEETTEDVISEMNEDELAEIIPVPLPLDSIFTPEILQKIEEVLDSETLIADAGRFDNTKWAIGGQFNPTYAPYPASDASLRITEAYNEFDIADTNPEKVEPVKKQKVIFSTGIGLRYFIKKRWAVQTGLFYSKFNDDNEHLEIPAMVNYYLMNRRIDLSVSLGCSYGVLVAQKERNYDPMNLSAMAGCGAGINISKHIAFSVQPAIKYNLPINNNYFAQRKSFSYSVFLGLTYTL